MRDERRLPSLGVEQDHLGSRLRRDQVGETLSACHRELVQVACSGCVLRFGCGGAQGAIQAFLAHAAKHRCRLVGARRAGAIDTVALLALFLTWPTHRRQIGVRSRIVVLEADLGPTGLGCYADARVRFGGLCVAPVAETPSPRWCWVVRGTGVARLDGIAPSVDYWYGERSACGWPHPTWWLLPRAWRRRGGPTIESLHGFAHMGFQGSALG